MLSIIMTALNMKPTMPQIIALCTILLISAGCSSPTPADNSANSPFTHGNVTLNLKKGVTTQADVLKVFGAPNIATVDSSSNEVWSYQKNATISNSSSSEGAFTIIIAAAGTTRTQFETSSRTMTLIIKFDANKVVSDFSSFTSNF